MNAHEPISVDYTKDITPLLTMEKPTKSYAICGHLHNTGNGGYFKFNMDAGYRLTLSLMTPGYDASIPDLIVLSPATSGNTPALPVSVSVPPYYGVEIIKGQKPVTGEFEPFFTCCNFRKCILL